MYVPKHRYHDEVRRYALAVRLVSNGVRPKVVRQWTRLSAWRVKELYIVRSQQVERDELIRLRGPAATTPTTFLRNPRTRDEAGALCAIGVMLGGMSAIAMPNARRDFPTLERGEILCNAYDMFLRAVGDSSFTLEHALQLAYMISQGELKLGNCIGCNAAIVFGADTPEKKQKCSECNGTPNHRLIARNGATEKAIEDEHPPETVVQLQFPL